MPDLTPERVRDAAEVVQQFGWKDEAAIMRDHAKDMERAQAAEAKREKRIEELTDELICEAYGWDPLPAVSDMRRMSNLARTLIDRYPALVESTDE